MAVPLIRNIQLLRFVAALSVATSHASDRLIPHDPAHRAFWSVPWTAGVDLFFVISGFVMMHLTHGDFGRPGAAAGFLKRRLVRIVPPYWFFTTVTVVAVLAADGRLGGTTVDAAKLATSYAFLPWPRDDGQLAPVLAQGWTLNHEMFFYLAFAAALCVRRGAVLLAAGLASLALLHPLAPAGWIMAHFWTQPIIVEFVGGMALARLYRTGFLLSAAGAAAGIALAVIAFVLIDASGIRADRAIRFGVPALLLAASVILLPEAAQAGAVSRFIRRGGDASYALYLSHYMIVNAVALAWLRLAPGLPWIGVALALAISMTFAMLFFRFVEHPTTGLLQRLAGVRRPSRADEVAP